MLRTTALVLTVLTGMSALVYEVTWQRYLATLLGSHAEATSAVLAIFLGGLSVGYAFFGSITKRLVAATNAARRRPHLLLFYGLVEIGIGGYALVFPVLFDLAQRASLLIPPGSDALAFAFDVLLSALLIGPPAVLMGGTIPFLSLALPRDLSEATRIHAAVYGLNTVGAVLGALLGGFWIVPALGLDGALRAMALVNLVAGTGFLVLDRFTGEIRVERGAAEAARAPARSLAFGWVALSSGFALMSLQTTLNRIGALALGSSEYTFSMVVAVFVSCIALGSLGVSLLPRVPRLLLPLSQALLFALLVLLYLAAPDATYWAHVIRTLFQAVDAAFYPYHGFVFVALLVVLALPIGLSGALLPLLFHELRREVSDLGAVAGRLYAWNTVGSLLGALLGGYVLLYWLDLHHVYRIALAAIGVQVAILLVLSGTLRPAVAGACALAMLAGPLLLPAWDSRRLAAGLFRQRIAGPATFAGPDEFFASRKPAEILFYDDDPTSTISVSRHRTGRGDADDLAIVVNGKSDGAVHGDYTTTALLALVPSLMARRIERCFVIGWGTGVTVGELAALDGTREVEVAEISTGVLAAAPLFDPANLRASRNPKVRVRRGDAYRTLLRSTGRYDVIVSEPSNPWVTGVEMLYSIEFLRAARERLAPGGVFAQWFHSYEIDLPSIDLVLRNYAAAFPHASVWFTKREDLLLLGFDDVGRALDLPALEARFEEPDFAAAFRRIGISSLGALLAHEILPLGTLVADEVPGPVHSLRHPLLSHTAARAFFRGREAALPKFVEPGSSAIGAENSLWRRYVRGGDGSVAESALAEAARETCRQERLSECVTLFARWQTDHPDSPLLRETLALVRKQGPEMSTVSPRTIERVAALYRDSDGDRDSGAALAQARALSERYVRYYHHAVPFDRAVLERAWKRCGTFECSEARRLVEQTTGPLDGAGRSDPPPPDAAR